MITIIKPDYCINKELECEKCSFYWPEEKLCSLISNEELSNTKIKNKEKNNLEKK